MITIGRLAEYAGVTVKTVRHYHRRGLLDEPARDASGYRRYTAADALQLVKVRTLAEAGVPLARIKELLTAEPEAFTAQIADIDRILAERAEQIDRTRRRLAQLRGGNRLFVSAEVADFLDRLRVLGVSDRTVQMEQDGWTLMQASAPDQAARWIADKLAAIDDPQFRAIYLDYDAAFDWRPDDPRLDELAERTGQWLAGRDPAVAGDARPAPDPTLVRLVASITGSSSPGWNRLARSGAPRRPD